MRGTIDDLEPEVRAAALSLCDLMICSVMLQVVGQEGKRIKDPALMKFEWYINDVLCLMFTSVLLPEQEPFVAQCILRLRPLGHTVEPVSVVVTYEHGNRFASLHPELTQPSTVVIERKATKTVGRASWDPTK